MGKDKSFASNIYKQAKLALKESNLFKDPDEKMVKIVAFECNSPLKAVVLITNEELNNQINESRVSMIPVAIINHFSLNLNYFDQRGDMKWLFGHKSCDKRGGYDYYFPIEWKGYGLSVLDKYGKDTNWLPKWKSGWVIGYHGMSSNIEEVKSVLDNKLIPGSGQLYQYHDDVNKLKPAGERKVGRGIYFAQKIEIAQKYSVEVVPRGCTKAYIIILQCRLKPDEIRIRLKRRNTILFQMESMQDRFDSL